jgi:hypothetical protein
VWAYTTSLTLPNGGTYTTFPKLCTSIVNYYVHSAWPVVEPGRAAVLVGTYIRRLARLPIFSNMNHDKNNPQGDQHYTGGGYWPDQSTSASDEGRGNRSDFAMGNQNLQPFEGFATEGQDFRHTQAQLQTFDSMFASLGCSAFVPQAQQNHPTSYGMVAPHTLYNQASSDPQGREVLMEGAVSLSIVSDLPSQIHTIYFSSKRPKPM